MMRLHYNYYNIQTAHCYCPSSYYIQTEPFVTVRVIQRVGEFYSWLLIVRSVTWSKKASQTTIIDLDAVK